MVNPPYVGFTVIADLKNLSKISCFTSSEGRVPTTLLGTSRVEVRMTRPFAIGRTRLNCTLPSDNGRRWHWLGSLFVVTKSWNVCYLERVQIMGFWRTEIFLMRTTVSRSFALSSFSRLLDLMIVCRDLIYSSPRSEYGKRYCESFWPSRTWPICRAFQRFALKEQ